MLWCQHPSPRWHHFLPLHASWWPELQLQSRSTRPEAATELLIEEDCNQQNIVLLSDSCLLFSLFWTAPLTSHPAATQQPVYSVRQQQSSTPVDASTCWHCRKRDCRQIGKGSSKTPSTPPLHPIQRCQDLSETEQKQNSFWRLRNNGHGPQKDQTNTLDRRTQTTIFRVRTGHCGLKRNIWRD